MSCEQKSLLQRLAVENAEALEGEAWQEHLEECGECREEWHGFVQSLAVFRQLESERIAACPPLPSWETFSRTLAQHSRFRWPLGAVRLPVASAVAGLLLIGGVAGWQLWDYTAPPGTETAATETDPAVAPDKPDAAFQQWTIPAGQLDVVARRSQQHRRPPWFTVPGRGSFVFEVKNDFSGPLNVEMQRLPGRFGTGEAVSGGQSRADGEAGWQPPVTTPVSGRAYTVQYPTYRSATR